MAAASSKQAIRRWGNSLGVRLPVAIAREAHRRKTGARALRGIVEELMLDLMYDLPNRDDVHKFVVTQEMVEERHGPKVLAHPTSLEQKETA